MKIKVFEPNRYGKIEFTRAELEKLLNEVYADGYQEGGHNARSHSWTWTSPYLSTSGISICNAATIDPTFTSTSANCATNNKIEAVLDNSNVLATKVNTASTVNDTTTYPIEANGSIIGVDLNKPINDIFISDSKKIEDAFDKLAKELNF